MTSTFAVSIHDVAPATWDACLELLELLAGSGAASTLLVVPRHHGGVPATADARFISGLHARVAAGDEVSLHGYFHYDDGPAARTPVGWARRRLYTASEGEFDALDSTEAARRLQLGRTELEQAGFTIRSFVAPAWLLGAGARQALARSPLAYTCSRDSLIRIRDGATIAAPSLVWSTRSAWRRGVSGWWNARRLKRLADAPLLRLAMHPADARHPATMAAWREVVERLAATRVSAREFDVIERTLGP